MTLWFLQPSPPLFPQRPNRHTRSGISLHSSQGQVLVCNQELRDDLPTRLEGFFFFFFCKCTCSLSVTSLPPYRAVYLHRFGISANIKISWCIFSSKSLLKEYENSLHLWKILCIRSSTQRRIHLSFFTLPPTLWQKSPVTYTFLYFLIFGASTKVWWVEFTMMLNGDHVDNSRW